MIFEPLIAHSIPYYAYLWTGADFGPHWHAEMEVMHCIEGKINVVTEERTYLLTPGITLFLCGNEPHSFRTEGESSRLMILKFGYSLLGSRFSQLQSKCIFAPLEHLPVSVRTPLQALRDCLLKHGVLWTTRLQDTDEWYVRGQMFLLANALLQLPGNERRSETQVNRTSQLDGIYPVLDYVKKHYAEPIDLDTAAALTGYAKTYFCRQFKLITGTSFHRYLNCYRISVACMLLEDGRLSVGQVAERTGFSSAKLLCRTFKEITGMTTSQYQKLPVEQKTFHWMR